MKVSGKIGSGPMNSDYLTLVRRALAEVCIISVLLVTSVPRFGRGNVSSRVCLSACEQNNSKTRVWIFVKFG